MSRRERNLKLGLRYEEGDGLAAESSKSQKVRLKHKHYVQGRAWDHIKKFPFMMMV